MSIELIEDLGIIQCVNNRYRRAVYKCLCGEIFECNKYYDHKLHKISCKKCGARKSFTTHNLSKTRLYSIFTNMKTRCFNINDRSYKIYGGKGVSICDEWKNDFINFFEWSIKNGYSEELTIDRIDNNGNYEPANCRWVNRSVQSRNTSRIRKNNTSGYRGVQLNKYKTKWESWIVVNRKKIYLGLYKKAEDAAIAYDVYVIKNNLEHTKNFQTDEILIDGKKWTEA